MSIPLWAYITMVASASRTFFKQVVITSKMCLAILCIYVCVCVYVLTVCFILFSESYTTSIPQGEECDVVDT